MNPQTERAEQLDAVDDQYSPRRTRRGGMHSSSIAGGVFLVGLGMLVLTGWWWPGIMLVIGLASAAELARRGQMLVAIGTFLGFAAIPVGIALVSAIGVPWL